MVYACFAGMTRPLTGLVMETNMKYLVRNVLLIVFLCLLVFPDVQEYRPAQAATPGYLLHVFMHEGEVWGVANNGSLPRFVQLTEVGRSVNLTSPILYDGVVYFVCDFLYSGGNGSICSTTLSGWFNVEFLESEDSNFTMPFIFRGGLCALEGIDSDLTAIVCQENFEQTGSPKEIFRGDFASYDAVLVTQESESYKYGEDTFVTVLAGGWRHWVRVSDGEVVPCRDLPPVRLGNPYGRLPGESLCALHQ